MSLGRGMDSLEAEGSSPPAMIAVIAELTKVRQSVAALANLRLVDPLELPTAKLLVEQTASSISKAFAVLESEKGRNHTEAQVGSPSSDVTIRSPVEKRKIQNTRKATNRKRGNPYSWKRITSATIDDGYAWRKYGQKEIFNAKYPRNYFRCTNKYDRGCEATRQVQKSEDDPFSYVITYFGKHTCGAEKENNPRCKEPCVTSFESNAVNGTKQEIPFSSFSSPQQENEEEGSKLTSCNSLSNYFELPEELQKPSMIELEPDWSDSWPGLNSSITSYDMEFMELGDILGFDQNKFFT
ncbi:probable WRKY transcription factor 46 [Phalaenopsis equestris]|uniref:probable WRKY transcription factor 46 n=1 Tax=Phalaenopsis equestris TaxID=78828 RepID=UPI0009E44E73|nr:probable WRKY transcription factor 46 [Phalaenopsis equestris]